MKEKMRQILSAILAVVMLFLAVLPSQNVYAGGKKKKASEQVQYQVYQEVSGFYRCQFEREKPFYEEGEEVGFQVLLQPGIQMSNLYVTKVSEEKQETVDIFYNEAQAQYSFIMPKADVKIVVEISKDGAMLLSDAADETPVPDKFKLINTGSIAQVPDSYQADAVNKNAATQIRKVVFIDEEGNEVVRWAFCLQPNLDCPPGGTYDKNSEQVELLESGAKEKNLAKCLYYLYGGPAWGKNVEFADGSGSINMKALLEEHGCSSTGNFFAVTHYMLAYIYVGANGNWNANSGVQNVMNSTGQEKIAMFVSYLKKLPVPRVELTKNEVTAVEENGIRVSETVNYKAIDENIATVKLPEGITLVNETTGERGTGTVKLAGGTKFHLEAAEGITGTGSYSFKCKYAVDFTALALKTAGKQDVGFSYYSGEKTLELSVKWPELKEEPRFAGITIYKEGEMLTGTQKTENGLHFVYEKKRLPGAVFKITAGEEIKNDSGMVVYQKGAVVAENLITGTDGSVSISNLPFGTYLVTESKAPAGFSGTGETKTVTVKDEDQKETTVFQTVTFENERKKAEIAVRKLDKNSEIPLAGAQYGLYAGNDIYDSNKKMAAAKDTLIEQITTGNDGTAVFTADLPIGYSYYVKEIKAPENYLLNTADIFTFFFTDASSSEAVTAFQAAFVNTEPKGKMTVYKEGEILTGIREKENGIVFLYEKRRQKNAVYQVYAGADIKTASGKMIYKKGDLVADNLKTGEDGSAVLENLYLGTYIIKEVKAPENFVNLAEEREVVISYEGQNVETVFSETTFYNERQKAEVTVQKLDTETKNPLKNGVFGLYAGVDIFHVDGKIIVKKDTLLECAVTDASGNAIFQTDLPLGYRYYVKELQAPEGYYRNSAEVYTFDFLYTNENEMKQRFSYVFENERVDAVISLVKKDKENDAAQGDASLENAVYGLYAGEDIFHPDGRTGLLYQKGTKVAALTTDAKGKAEVRGLYPGNYYIKELTPPKGYLLDEKEYEISCTYQGDTVKTIEQTCTFTEVVMKQPFQIIKAANNGNTDAELLKGAGFTAYLVSSLLQKEDGSYDFENAKPVILGENGATEIFTDEKGYAVSIPLPYGTYLVKETTVPHNYKPVKDFLVQITENNPSVPKTWRVLLDEEFVAKLKIVKKDAQTKLPVLKAGAEFKVYDLDAKKYVEQVTTYPAVITHKTYKTNEAGYLILPQNLPMGHYRIEEVTAPDGYTRNQNHVEISIDSESAYQIDPLSNDVLIEAVYENQPVKGELTIIKSGEVLSGYKKEFLYKERRLKGAVFAVYAAEDLYTADRQGIAYAKDVLIAELITDENGKAILKDLPLGRYRIVEKTAPEGMVCNSAEHYVELTYADQETPVVSETIEIVNERQKVMISVRKKDTESEKPLSGAEFALYAKEDILADEQVIVKADTRLAAAVTDKEGRAVFEMDLPHGNYYVKEEKAPVGYASTEEIVEVTASYEGQEMEVVYLEAEFQNQPTIVSFTKCDITTGVELEGAVLTVLDKDGNLLDTWTSVKGEAHEIRGLAVGETYILREETAPYGYLQAEEVEFTVLDTAKIQKVEMKDAVPTGRITINKYGEFVGKVTWNDMVSGAAEALFGYVTGSLKGVTFEVYALEEIKAADGVSEAFYKKDELVTTITTDALGYARATDLPLGKYYVVEKETAKGFVLDDKKRVIDLSYRDQNTSVVTYEEDWQNNRQKASVTVWKKEKGTEVFLEGAIFALCAKEEIVGADGKVLLQADTVMEQKVTDSDGKIRFLTDLPVGDSYYIKEVQAPMGYVKNEEMQEFVFQYAGGETAEIPMEFTFENDIVRGKVTLQKVDKETGKPLPGVAFTLYNREGTALETLITDQEGYAESGLYPIAVFENGNYKEAVVYTLRETKPLEGYIPDTKAYEVTFAYVDDQTPVVEQNFVFENEKVPETENQETEISETEPEETESETETETATEVKETKPEETESETKPEETESETNAPETGDHVRLHLLAGLWIISGCVISKMMLKRKN